MEKLRIAQTIAVIALITLAQLSQAYAGDAGPFTLHLGGMATEYFENITNNANAPLTGVVLREMNFPHRPPLIMHPVVRCKTHSPAVNPGQRWIVYIHSLQISQNQIAIEAATYSDGTSWGSPRGIAKLRQMESQCNGR